MLGVGLIVVSRRAPLPLDGWAWWVAGLVVAGAGAGALAGWLTRPGPAAAARELDRRLALHDLLSSALELGGSGSPSAALLVARSERVAAAVRPRAVLPLATAMRTGLWGWLGPVLAIGVSVGLWLPARVQSGREMPSPAPAALTREAVDVVREAAAAMEASAEEQAVPRGAPASEWQQELERELAAAGRTEVETRALAAQAAEAAAESLEESAGRATDRADSLAERLAIAAAANGGTLGGARDEAQGSGAVPEAHGPGDVLRDSIREGKLNDAAAALAEARRRLAEMSPQERESLARELERWASEVSRTKEAESARSHDQPSRISPGNAAAPETAPQTASETLTERESTPAGESGETTPAGEAAPSEGDAARSDPLAEQLRDAAREVRGEPGAQEQTRDAPRPRDASQQPGDPQRPEAQPPKHAEGQQAPGREPRGPGQDEQQGADGQGGEQSADEKRPAPSGQNDSKPRGTKPGETEPGDTKPGATKPGETKPGETKPSDNMPGGKKPGDSKPTQSSPGQAQPSQTQPGTQTPGDRAPDAATPAPSGQSVTGTKPNAGDPRTAPTDQNPPELPGRVSPGEAPTQQPDARPGRQPPGGLEGLERTLRESERLRERAAQDAARARYLRERARELLSAGESGPGSDEADRPGVGGGGESPEPRRTQGMYDEPDPRGAGAFPPVDEQLDLRPRGDAEGPMTPLAEWDRAAGDGSPAPVGPGVAGRLRAAAGNAERAIEDRRVPAQYADLVRRVFRRYVDRAPGGGAP